MTKCEICGDEISAVKFRNHLRKCMIYNISLTYYMEQLHFLNILDAINSARFFQKLLEAIEIGKHEKRGVVITLQKIKISCILA